MSPAQVFVRIPGSHHPGTRLRLVSGFRDPGSVLILGQVTQYGNPYLICTQHYAMTDIDTDKVYQCYLRKGKVYRSCYCHQALNIRLVILVLLIHGLSKVSLPATNMHMHANVTKSQNINSSEFAVFVIPCKISHPIHYFSSLILRSSY